MTYSANVHEAESILDFTGVEKNIHKNNNTRQHHQGSFVSQRNSRYDKYFQYYMRFSENVDAMVRERHHNTYHNKKGGQELYAGCFSGGNGSMNRIDRGRSRGGRNGNRGGLGGSLPGGGGVDRSGDAVGASVWGGIIPTHNKMTSTSSGGGASDACYFC